MHSITFVLNYILVYLCVEVYFGPSRIGGNPQGKKSHDFLYSQRIGLKKGGHLNETNLARRSFFRKVIKVVRGYISTRSFSLARTEELRVSPTSKRNLGGCEGWLSLKARDFFIYKSRSTPFVFVPGCHLDGLGAPRKVCKNMQIRAGYFGIRSQSSPRGGSALADKY